MAKTLVEPAHEGQHINGFGGCHTRWCSNGYCSGQRTADWLNSLGDNSDTFITVNKRIITVGEVRQNWLNGSEHIKRVN